MSRRAAVGGFLGTATLAGLGGCAVGAPPPQSAPGQPAPSAVPPQHRTRVVLLGTAGGPGWAAAGGRAGICSAVVVDDAFYVVDAGEGAGRQLQAALGTRQGPGVLTGLRGIFLTHLHSDHTADLNNLLASGLFNGLRARDTPVPVWGPGNRGALHPLFGSDPAPPLVAAENPTPGTRELVELMVRTFASDYNDRARDNRVPVPARLFEGRDVPVPAQYLARPNEDPHPRMAPFPFYSDDRVQVSATLVQHAPAFPALAFRFDTADGSVVFSGDTSPSENLIELATGADVLVHEAIDGAAMEARYPQPRNPADEATLQHVLGAHTTIEQVGPIAERAGAATLVLNHLAPGYIPVQRWQEAQQGYSGRLVVGADLDQIGVGAPR